MRAKTTIFLTTYLLCLFFSAESLAISSNVPPESELYEKLEKLYAFGLVAKRIEAVKPISREDFARQVKEASINIEKLQEFNNPLILSIIEELKKEFSKELEGSTKPIVRIFDEARTEFIYLKQNPTPHIETNAVNKPLASNRSGETLEGGFNWVSSINGYMDFPKFASFYIEPRMEIKQEQRHFRLDMYRGFLKLGRGNFELAAGRDAQIWGNSYSGNIELGNNAQGLTMVKISNPLPGKLPWIFKHLGPLKFSFFFAVLESQRDHGSPTFWGTSIFFRPSRYVEWGLSRTTMLGGKGTDSLSFGEYFFEAATGLRIYDSTVVNAGNGTLGFYFLFTLPFLRNTKIFFDGYWEDIGFGNLKRKTLFTRDLAFVTGIDVPRLNSSGTLSLKSEFVKTTQITYRNSVYTDGYTYNREILGHPIGPDAWGNYTVFGFFPDTAATVKLHFNYELHGRTGLSQHGGPLPAGIFEEPEERFSVIAAYEKRISRALKARLKTGYERISNYAFKSGIGKNNAIVSAGLDYRF